MNTAHLHLMLNHLPIIGLGYSILMNLYAIYSRNEEIKKLSLWFYIITGILVLPAFLTGEGAEEIMKTYPGITEETVEPHERMGLYFFIGVLLLAVASAAGAFLAKGREAILKKFNLYLIVCAVIVCIFGVIAGSTGGKIKHNEITQGVYQKH